MKQLFTFLTATTTLIGLALASWDYEGPLDERKWFRLNYTDYPMGQIAQLMQVGAMADVIEDGAPTQDWRSGGHHDPLFPAECQDNSQDIYDRSRRYGEDE